jgi:hypothetical protein
MSSHSCCNHARMLGGIAGTELEILFICASQPVFSGSSDFQPSGPNSTIDPSRCLHLNEKFIGNALAANFVRGCGHHPQVSPGQRIALRSSNLCSQPRRGIWQFAGRYFRARLRVRSAFRDRSVRSSSGQSVREQQRWRVGGRSFPVFHKAAT